jgi:DNA invertase Pin-like site-specific DNA recombinase
MLDQLREGDIVAVWKLDRLARFTRNPLEMVEAIGAAGARFQSLSSLGEYHDSRRQVDHLNGIVWFSHLIPTANKTGHTS